MHILFRSCKIIDPASPYHLDRQDIRIVDGRIDEIGTDLKTKKAKEIKLAHLSVSPSWIDMEVEAGDPGLEHREDLQSLAQAAIAGGYTKIGLRPHANPVIQDRPSVSYLMQQSRFLPISILPIGALSRNTDGKEITEMLDMRETGAVAFSDGVNSVQHAGILQRALLYVKTFDGLVLNQPLDISIAGKGQLHEGTVSTSLGMKGIPSLAEELMIERDLKLLEYTDSRLHISHLTTAKSVESVRKAKSEGLRVTASVSALHLLKTADALSDFNSHYKVLPPLREEEDRLALIEGLKDGTIDCISSNHCPRELEAKELEFAYADFGAVMLSTAFAAARTGVGDALSEEELIALFVIGPAKIYGLAVNEIVEKKTTSLTFYQYNQAWTPKLSDIKSKSKNAPLIGAKLKGKVIGVINNKQVFGFKDFFNDK